MCGSNNGLHLNKQINVGNSSSTTTTTITISTAATRRPVSLKATQTLAVKVGGCSTGVKMDGRSLAARNVKNTKLFISVSEF
jgi:hypothetical protein